MQAVSRELSASARRTGAQARCGKCGRYEYGGPRPRIVLAAWCRARPQHSLSAVGGCEVSSGPSPACIRPSLSLA